MKKIYSSIALLIVCNFVFSQNINQFDANGNRHGTWKKKFKDTDVLRYEGQFSHGKEIGLFKFYKNYKKKAVLSATKLFNKTDNIAVVQFLTSSGNIISEGNMKGKTHIGPWKYYHKNSKKLLTLENYNGQGLLTGKQLVYYPSGQLAEQKNYINGKLNGESLSFSEKNIVIKKYIYENDELHGLAQFYNSEGALIVEGQYKRGKKNGIWKYYKSGKLINQKDFTYKPKYVKK